MDLVLGEIETGIRKAKKDDRYSIGTFDIVKYRAGKGAKTRPAAWTPEGVAPEEPSGVRQSFFPPVP